LVKKLYRTEDEAGARD